MSQEAGDGFPFWSGSGSNAPAWPALTPGASGDGGGSGGGGGTVVTSGAPQITAPPPIDITALLNALGLGAGTPPVTGGDLLSGLNLSPQVATSSDTGGGAQLPWGLLIIVAAVAIGIWVYVRRHRS